MTLSLAILVLAVGFLGFTRAGTVTAYFQQEEYDNLRFVRAWPKLSLIDFKFSIAGILLMQAAALIANPQLGLVAAAGAGLGIAILERRAAKTMKKPLVRTQRAIRLMRLAMVLMAAVGLALVLWLSVWGAIIVMQLMPLALVVANMILTPGQRAENQRYVDQARAKLARYDGIKIGITGSFGKTTVKHALGDTLGQLSSVYYSEGSINTVLGHTRHIRQRLQPAHRYFIAEMGAYGEGSIHRLCTLIDPDHAIITSIGLAHNERFGGLDVVAKAKAELAQWVAAKGGLIVMTQDVARYEPFADIAAKFPSQCIIVGEDAKAGAGAPLTYQISDVTSGPTGTEIGLTGKRSTGPAEKIGEGLELSLPLLGGHNSDNLALIAALLLELGWSADAIKSALGGVRHVPHRLAPRPGPNGSTILDDAYNANPVGMRNALDLAQAMAQRQGGKAYAITPGLVELGDRHDDEHRALGSHAATRLEKTIVVTPGRVPTLVEGIESSDGGVDTAPSYLAARAMIDPDLCEGDVLLIANDLPDLLGSRVWL